MASAASASAFASVAAEAFTGALSAAANGVSIVAARHGDRRAGLTVSSMCSVCAEPPLLLACVNTDNEFDALAARTGCFSVNILEARHVDLALVFAGLSEPPLAGSGREPSRFDVGSWDRMVTGAPVLDDALVALDCTLDTSIERGTHRIWIGRVVGVRTAPGVPLVYTSRAFAQTLPIDPGDRDT